MINRICCIEAGCVRDLTMALIADRCEDVHVTVVDLNLVRIDD